MILQLLSNWNFFLVCFGVMLITSAVMSALARSFFTMGTSKKGFSMFDLELPSSAISTQHLLSGIDQLGGEAVKVKKALRGQLYVDFLFMPATYLGILFLCHKVAEKAGPIGGPVFYALACLQLICWLCDIIENCVLLSFIKRPRPYSNFGFFAWNIMESTKWGGSLVGFFSVGFALIYFWTTGHFHKNTAYSLLGLVIETVIIIFIMGRILKKSRPLR